MKDNFQQIYNACKKKGETAFIDAIKQDFPEIQKLESLDDLINLELTDVNDRNGGVVIMLTYKATAPTIYPHIRKGLIEKGVAKKHNVYSTGVQNNESTKECIRTHLTYYGARLQIFLDVYKQTLETHNSPASIPRKDIVGQHRDPWKN